MKKYFLISTLILISVLLLYFIQHSQQPSAASNPFKQNITLYHTPELLPQHPRPVITVDENSNRRWVRRLEDSSLRGSQVDRPSLRYDEQGITQIGSGTVFYFSYFLSLTGEMAPERIQQFVYDDMFAHYPSNIANQFYNLFVRYQQYQQAFSNFLSTLDDNSITKYQITEEKIRQYLQPQFFTEKEVEQLFHAYDRNLDFKPRGKAISEQLEAYLQSTD